MTNLSEKINFKLGKYVLYVLVAMQQNSIIYVPPNFFLNFTMIVFSCNFYLSLPQLSVAVIPTRLKTEMWNVNVRPLVVEFPTNVGQVTN